MAKAEMMLIPPGTQLQQQFNAVTLYFPSEDDAIMFMELVQTITKPLAGAHAEEKE